jgi:YHS domain-containing protein
VQETAEIESPKLAADSAAEATVQHEEPRVREVADAQPTPKPPQPKALRVQHEESRVREVADAQPAPKSPLRALRANWMAALHPRSRGDVLWSMAAYRSTPKPPQPEAPRVKHEEPRIGEVADARPTLKPTQPAAPQANWTAALDPGFRDDILWSMATYRSTGLARAAVHQTPVEPRRRPADEESQPTRPACPSGRTCYTRPPDGKLVSYIEEPRHDGSLPVALDGFCPVELGDKGHWVAGNPQITAVHRGFTYRLSGDEQRKRFLANPERYAPMFSGEDPVLIVDGQRHVRGQTDYCVAYNGRLYMFSGAATLARFQTDPQRYTRNLVK